MPESSADVASLRAWKEAHEDRCKERYDANARDLSEIKASLLAISVELKSSIQRIHEQREAQDRGIHELAKNTTDAINGLTSATATDISAVNARIDDQKIWNLTAVIAGAGAIIAWLAERIWGKV